MKSREHEHEHEHEHEDPLAQPAAWPFRLPIIRHLRYFVLQHRINNWYALWGSVGYFENNDFDRRCLDQVWRGII